jgi:predicted O-methyltransferase YrrM
MAKSLAMKSLFQPKQPRLRVDSARGCNGLLTDYRTYDTAHPAYDATAVRNFPSRILNSVFPSDNPVYAFLQGHASGSVVPDEVWVAVLEDALDELRTIPYTNQLFDGIDYVEKYRRDLEYKYKATYFPGWVSIERALFLYWATRKMNPQIVVQTGVCNGLSTAFITLALVKNETRGLLHAIDLPAVFDPTDASWTKEGKVYGLFIPEGKDSGWLVPDKYRDRLRLHQGDAKKLLPSLLESLNFVDMFYHDSDHSYNHMTFEFNEIKRRLTLGGLVVADDIAWNSSLWDFADREGAPAYNFKGAMGAAFF